MEFFAYCQQCRHYLPLTLSPGVDSLFGLVQQHTCGKCGHIVGAVRRDAAEIVKEGV